MNTTNNENPSGRCRLVLAEAINFDGKAKSKNFKLRYLVMNTEKLFTCTYEEDYILKTSKYENRPLFDFVKENDIKCTYIPDLVGMVFDADVEVDEGNLQHSLSVKNRVLVAPPPIKKRTRRTCAKLERELMNLEKRMH